MGKVRIKTKTFDEATGVTTVVVGTPLGEFTGKTTFKEETGSPSFERGVELAEWKASIKYVKALKRMYKTKAAAMKEYLDQITDMKECNAYSKEGTKAYKMMNEYLDYARIAQETVDSMKIIWRELADVRG